jgi:hypothetical protein
MLACKNSGMVKSGMYTFVYLMLIVLFLPSICPAAGDLVVPEGTKIKLQLNERLSTKDNKEGDIFTAVVVEPINQGDQLAIPKGSKVNGSISRISRPGVMKGKATIYLLFESISIPGRGDHAIDAVLDSVGSEENGSHPEGTIKGNGSIKKDIGRVLLPTLLGVGIGGLVGGQKGIEIGGIIGASTGAGAVLIAPGETLQLSRGTALKISLEKPLIIPADTEGATARNH